MLKVIDGNTVKIEYENKPTRVRLIGVDTPEMATSGKPAERFGLFANLEIVRQGYGRHIRDSPSSIQNSFATTKAVRAKE